MKFFTIGLLAAFSMSALAEVPYVLWENNDSMFQVQHKMKFNANFDALDTQQAATKDQVYDLSDSLDAEIEETHAEFIMITTRLDDIDEESYGEQLINYQPTGAKDGDTVQIGSTPQQLIAKTLTTLGDSYSILDLKNHSSFQSNASPFSRYRDKPNQIININGFRIRIYERCNYFHSYDDDNNIIINSYEEDCLYYAMHDLGRTKNLSIYSGDFERLNDVINNYWIEKTQ